MIFKRPTKAFFAFEQSLLRPPTWPPTRHDVPTLWERAKAMFDVLLKRVGAAARLAQYYRLRNTERREINARLRPVERIVRTLLMLEAITFLLMTPEGLRIRREATPVAPPAPPAPPKAPHSTRILMPGWHTIAALHPRIDPRVVEREQREALARAQMDMSVEADLPGEGAHDPGNPATWRVRFPVLHWVKPETPAQPPHRPRILCAVLDDASDFPITHALVPPAPAREQKESPDADPGAIVLARRIEALSRVLADPARAIQQLARRLAAIPAGMIGACDMSRVDARRWHHGKPEAWNASLLAEPAVNALNAAATAFAAPPPEPG